MSDLSATRDELTPDEVLLAEFVQEIARLGTEGVDLAAWLLRAPELEDRLRGILHMQRMLESARPAQEPVPPKNLGEFRIVRWVGGNLGAVYEAIQEPLGRRVAVKTIRQGKFTSEMQARFLREQKVLASLHQTHIVPIFTAGVEGPLQYFAMPYIEGAALHHVIQSLGELQSSNPGSQTPALKDLAKIATHDAGGADASTLTRVGDIQLSKAQPEPPPRTTRVRLSREYVRSVARVMADVATAVQHAHDHRILHRDIKPSNIMVDQEEQSWIIDFGLARYMEQTAHTHSVTLGTAAATVHVPHGEGRVVVGDVIEPHSTPLAGAQVTVAGGVLGTPSYMAPEQFGGTVDERTDVWGLGATLYELLTLQRPFGGGDLSALEKAIKEGSPTRPRLHVAQLPADLEAVCLKALQKDPAKRYQTAREFAQDLRRWINDEPVHAPRLPPLVVRRMTNWGRKNKGTVVALVTIVAALVVGVWGLFLQESRERQLLAIEVTRSSHIQDAQAARRPPRSAGWSEKSLQSIEHAAAIRTDDPLRDEAAASLAGMDAVLLRDWNLRSSSVSYSSDGHRLLIGGGINGSQTRLWHAATDTFSESKQTGFGPVGFSPSGDGLQWFAETPWTFVLWNVSQQAEMCRVSSSMPDIALTQAIAQHLFQSIRLAMSRDTSLLATSVLIPDAESEEREWDGETYVWNSQGELLHTFAGHASALCFSPDNTLLAAGRTDGTIEIMSLEGEEPPVTFQRGASEIHALDFGVDPASPAGAKNWLLAAGDAGSVVRVWDVAQRSPRSLCAGSGYNVFAVQFSPDGMTLATGGRDGARFWDPLSGRLLLHAGATVGDYISDLAFTADGTQLAIAAQGPPSSDQFATTVWSIEAGRGISLLRGLSSQIVNTCLSVDGEYVAALAQNWEIGVYGTSPPRLLRILQAPAGFFADSAALAINSDNRVAFSTGREVREWDFETGEMIASHSLPPGFVDQLAYTSEGDLLSFRCECRDGRTMPFGTSIADFPRVLRLRNLSADDPLSTVVEIDRFNAHVFCGVAHPQGEFFVAEGLHVGPEGEFQEIMLIDGATGEELWRHAPAEPNGSPFLKLDPTGEILGDQDANGHCVLYRIPSGEVLPQTTPVAFALGPHGDSMLTAAPPKFDGTQGFGLTWRRRDQSEPIAVLGIDLMPHSLSPCFSRDGRWLVFGTRDGQVAVCDLPEIERRLEPF